MRQRNIDNSRTDRFARGRPAATPVKEPRMRFRQERTVPIPMMGAAYPRRTRRVFARMWRRFGMAFWYACLGVGGVLVAVAIGAMIVVWMH